MDDMATLLSIVFEIGRFLAAAALGVFAGAMLTEGGVLVPYWRSLAPKDFLAWYGANGQRLQGFFGPVTTITALLTLASASGSMWEGHPGCWLSLLAAVLALIIVSTFFIYFQKANVSFSTGSVGVENVAVELARWSTWHWWRTGLSLIALAAAAAALWRIR